MLCGNSHFLLRRASAVLPLVSENSPCPPRLQWQLFPLEACVGLIQTLCASLQNAQGRSRGEGHTTVSGWIGVGSTALPSLASPSDGTILVFLWAAALSPISVPVLPQGQGHGAQAWLSTSTPLWPQGWTHTTQAGPVRVKFGGHCQTRV